MRYIQLLSLISLLATSSTYAAMESSSLTCKTEAVEEAHKLLAFYRDNDDRIVIDDKVTKSSFLLCWKRGDTSIRGDTECG